MPDIHLIVNDIRRFYIDCKPLECGYWLHVQFTKTVANPWF